MTIIDDYLSSQQEFEKKYGEDTIVLMQVGHFYEAYAVNNVNENVNGDNLIRLSDVLNIQLTRKNKSIIENSRKNPLMIGVNIWSIDKYIQILLNNNFTVVQIDQVTQPPNPERKITNIYSPGTNIQHAIKSDSNNLVSIFLETNNDLKNHQEIMCVGVSSIDLSTGENVVFETFSNIEDKNLALDEIFRFIQIHDPKELIFNIKTTTMTDRELLSYLDLNNRVCHIYRDDKIEKSILNKNYQVQFLEKVFPKTGLLSVIEYLDLELKHFGLLSYIGLLNFAYEHNENIIKKINKPEIWDDTKYLILTNNTINQLNVTPQHNLHSKYNSLFGVVNQTSTSIGRRLLRSRLLNPIIDSNTLNYRYDLIEKFITDENYKKYEGYLNQIVDIERLHRRMALQLIQPADFVSMDLSYENILNTINLDQLSINPNKEDINLFKQFIDEYRDEFDMDEIIKFHLDKINGSFFNKGKHIEIDNKQKSITKCHTILDKLSDKLSTFIEKNKENLIKVESNERDGFFLTLTKKRADVLKKSFSKTKTFNINMDGKDYTFNTSDFEFKNLTKTNTRLDHELIKNTSYKLRYNLDSLGALSKEIFLDKMNEFSDKYGETLKKIAKYVGEIDLIKSSAKTAINFGYKRPEIDMECDYSYLDVKSIRHPIIERIQTSLEYVPNDICLGTKEDKGLLLFGTNASGKSSLMKSIGLNVILAQAGMFVAAEEFKYRPYQYIFSRINNNDNIFKGESSFAVEMSELRSILKRSNQHSLILGDELCSGTESISAQSIFASSVIYLSKKESSFIFATHLHELCSLEEINDIDNISIKHLKVIYDKEKKILIYDRKLEEGSGPAIYGLEVCKAMDMDEDFLKMANNIRRKIMKVDRDILIDKKSHFNAGILIDKCKVCGDDAIDAHHIKFQSMADQNNMIGHIKKDSKHNLVPLCKVCHDKVHNGNLVINGYKSTSEGIELDFYYDEQKVKSADRKKFTEIQLEIIRELQNLPNMTQKLACDKLKNNHDIQISKSTLSKIWKNKY